MVHSKRKASDKIKPEESVAFFRDVESFMEFSLDYEAYLHTIIDYFLKKFDAEISFISFPMGKSKKITKIITRGIEPPKSLLTSLKDISTKSLSSIKTIHSNNINKNLKSIIIVPLLIREEKIGTIGIVNPNKKRFFPASDKKSLELKINKFKKEIYYIKLQYNYKEQLSRLRALFDISHAVRETLNLDKLLYSIMSVAKNTLNAEASSLAITDPKTNELIFTVAKGEKGKAIKEMRLKMGQGIIGSVAQNGKSLLIQNVKKDKRFFKSADKKTGFITKSILCVPLRVKNNIIGAVEVLNKTDGTVFNKDDMELLTMLSSEAAIAIENARLFNLATTDGLTTLNTIRYFRTLYDDEYSKCVRHKRKLSLILSDIDHFKNVNDTYGHQIGDLILRETANIMKNSVRDTDIVGRYGGEEFIIMLTETSRKNAVILADRIRKKIEEHVAVDDKGNNYKVTISMGVSSLSGKESPDELIKLADTALYKAKESGRNKVCKL
ncbi:MAG: sensor domain-containing diguanylate cyclase [Candidatus Ancaeobacter aquaticus]|nr:sensor domain-containing diguanylate cyclase [Candidatus Ancaeobacter aquaticus]